MPSCGSVFSGAGLLDIGLHLAGFEHAWLCEFDVFRRDLLRKRFPGAVVYDDIRTLRGPFTADAERDAVRQQPVAVGGRGDLSVAGRAGEAAADTDSREHAQEHPGDDLVDVQRGEEWRRSVESARAGGPPAGAGRRHPGALPGAGSDSARYARPVELVAGGFPCKGGSTAGKREGFEHAETVLWFEMRRVIREVRPRYVLIENVANLLGMAASPGEPDGSLWGTVLGDLAALGFGDIRWDCLPAAAVGAPHLRDRVFAVAAFTAGADAERDAGQRRLADRRADVAGGGDRAAANTEPFGRREEPAAVWQGRSKAERSSGVAVDWGDYQPAIARWEAIHGTAPEPLVRRLDDGDAKLQRVRSRVDRSRLSALGDGVHVYVGWLAGEHIMSLERARADRLVA